MDIIELLKIKRLEIEKIENFLELSSINVRQLYLGISENSPATLFKNLPDSEKNEIFCKAAVMANGMNLKFVPERFMSEELIIMAIQQNWNCHNDIPKRFLNRKIAGILINENSCYDTLKTIDKYLDTDLCWSIVVKNPSMIIHLPEKYLATDICEYAIEREPSMIAYIGDVRTEKIIRDVLKGCVDALRYVEKTPENIKTSIEHFPHQALMFVTITDKFPKELLELSVSLCGTSVEYIPSVFLSNKITKLAVSQDWKALKRIPRFYQTDEVCLIALKQNTKAIHLIK